MTPRELAEKIYEGLIPNGPAASRQFPEPIAFIESLISKALEEAVDEDRKVANNGFEYELARAVEDARRDTYEECVKIIEQDILPVGLDGREIVKMAYQRCLADRIRRRITEMK